MLSMAIAIPFLQDMMVMEEQYTTMFKTASAENGIPGTVHVVDTFGYVIVTRAYGNINMKKGPGGILPGTTLHDHVKKIIGRAKGLFCC